MSLEGFLPKSRILGVGMYVPERVVPNSYFESYLETSDTWITERTGIKERRWADENTSASDLGVKAAKKALQMAKVDVSKVDGIIVATATSDSAFPSTACMIQKKLLAPLKLAFDVSAACTGFIYALTVADSLIKSKQCKNILVIGTEVFSSIINKEDRSTCILFGDGAGAVLLGANEDSSSGIIGSKIYANGSRGDILRYNLGTAYRLTEDRFKNKDYFISMEGQEVFKFAVRNLSKVSKELLSEFSLKTDDISYIVSHQANKRIVDRMAKSLGVSLEKVPSNVNKYGNTSASSIPILLSEMVNEKRFKEGDLVLLNAVGAGMTWGASLIRW